MYLRRGQKGFTLVEIMIVVAIIGLLVAIAIPNFIRARTSARSRACANNMRQIHAAGEQYLLDNNATTFTYPDDVVGASSYIKTEPTCPSDGSAYTRAIASQVITITCGSAELGTFDGTWTP